MTHDTNQKIYDTKTKTFKASGKKDKLNKHKQTVNWNTNTEWSETRCAAAYGWWDIKNAFLQKQQCDVSDYDFGMIDDLFAVDRDRVGWMTIILLF